MNDSLGKSAQDDKILMDELEISLLSSTAGGRALRDEAPEAIFIASFAEFYRIHHPKIAASLALNFGDAELGREAGRLGLSGRPELGPVVVPPGRAAVAVAGQDTHRNAGNLRPGATGGAPGHGPSSQGGCGLPVLPGLVNKSDRSGP
jgi:hypothetical protein